MCGTDGANVIMVTGIQIQENLDVTMIHSIHVLILTAWKESRWLIMSFLTLFVIPVTRQWRAAGRMGSICFQSLQPIVEWGEGDTVEANTDQSLPSSDRQPLQPHHPDEFFRTEFGFDLRWLHDFAWAERDGWKMFPSSFQGIPSLFQKKGGWKTKQHSLPFFLLSIASIPPPRERAHQWLPTETPNRNRAAISVWTDCYF